MAISCALRGSKIHPAHWRDEWGQLDSVPHQRIAYRVLARWLQEFHEGKRPRWGLVLESTTTGVGKSHLVRTAGIELCRRGLTAIYCTEPDLMDELREAQRPDSDFGIVQVRRRYARANLLILDDVGKCREGVNGAVSPFVAEMMWNVLNDRAEAKLPVWVTCRMGADELKGHWGPRFGPDILSRLSEQCGGMKTWIRMDGPDLRATRPAGGERW